MKKRGFTLIELLAVIIVLAVIALIATPIVMNVIEDAKEGAAKTSALGFIDAVNNQVSINDLTSSNQIFDGVYDTDILQSTYGVTVKGTEPATGSWVKIGNSEVICYSLKEDSYVVTKSCDDGTETTEKTDTIDTNTSGNGGSTSGSTGGSSSALVVSQFTTDSWDTIKTAVQSGTYSYQVGDVKCVALDGFTTTNSNGCSDGEFLVRVVNTSACTNGETSETACGFVVEFVDVIADYKMTIDDNAGGWPSSRARNYLNDWYIYSALPSDLQNAIADTTVISGHGSTEGETNFTSTDKLYLLSTKEVYGTPIHDTLDSETRQLDYYKNNGVGNGNYTANGSYAVKNYNGSANTWWLRSVYDTSTASCLRVMPNGNENEWQCYGEQGIAPAFRIA